MKVTVTLSDYIIIVIITTIIDLEEADEEEFSRMMDPPFKCHRLERMDHDLFLARVSEFGEGRLGEDALLYSSRHGWRRSGEKARETGRSVRDELLERLAESESEPDA